MSLIAPVFLFCAALFLNSMYYNSRRTEDATYGLWNMILINLCGKRLGVLIPAPQPRLYTSKDNEEEPPTPDPDPAAVPASTPDPTMSSISFFGDISFSGLSAMTRSERPKVEVVPDFALLLVTPESRDAPKPRDRSAIFMEYLKNMKTRLMNIGSIWPYRQVHYDIHLRHASFPLLGEMKRSASRHPKSSQSHMKQVVAYLNMAIGQVKAQAHCLFSTPKFGAQEKVILIAASGLWWCWRFCYRGEFSKSAAFKMKSYSDNERTIWNEDDYPELDDAEEMSESDEMDDLVPPSKAMAMAALRQKQAMLMDGVSKKKEEDRKRDERAEKRNAMKEAASTHRSDPAQTGSTTDQNDGARPDPVERYTLIQSEEALKGAYTDEIRCRFNSDPPGLFNFKYELFSTDAPTDGERWSNPMRLGSEVSDMHLKVIKKYLEDLDVDGFWEGWTTNGPPPPSEPSASSNEPGASTAA